MIVDGWMRGWFGVGQRLSHSAAGDPHPRFHRPQKNNHLTHHTIPLYSGFNTFDLADIYGPAEEITGAYHKQFGPKDNGLFYTKVCLSSCQLSV